MPNPRHPDANNNPRFLDASGYPIEKGHYLNIRDAEITYFTGEHNSVNSPKFLQTSDNNESYPSPEFIESCLVRIKDPKKSIPALRSQLAFLESKLEETTKETTVQPNLSPRNKAANRATLNQVWKDGKYTPLHQGPHTKPSTEEIPDPYI
tara:strand:- start:1921 stop:2373 length:453 start_codon:yes stop_codon:yes gene_type:complete